MKTKSLVNIKSTSIILMLFTVIFLKAQDVPKVIPPSPEAASIVGYGNTGVNFYTGSPSLSIPIYAATSRGFSLPISLSYSGFGGIKVEEIAPWVGLGWSLNAGGTISRTIRGKADDGPGGYQRLDALPDLDPTTVVLYKKYADGVLDGEPDEYNYNVGGMSGTFFINKAKEIVEKVKSNVFIKPVFSGSMGTGWDVVSFEIITTDGTKYIFDELEKTKSFEATSDNTTNNLDFYTSSWYLGEVKDQNGYQLIDLAYYDWYSDSDQLKTINYYAQSELDLGEWFGPEHMKKSWSLTQAKRIKEINFGHGKILFNKSTAKRHDFVNDYRLDNIEIRDKANVLVKKFNLYYSYFTESGTALITSTAPSILFDNLTTGNFERRLRLDEIKEVANDNITTNPGHAFVYNANDYLPSRYSFAKDHWGYYNGRNSNTSPEPNQRVKYYDGQSNAASAAFGTANREPSETHAQAGVLKQVTYPTGGHTKFTFGEHEAVEAELKNSWVQATPIEFQPNNSKHTFTLSLINHPYQVLGIDVDVFGTCDVGVSILDLDDEYFKGITFTHIDGIKSHGTKGIRLPAGTYKIKAVLANCPLVSTDKVTLRWRNEVLKVNKSVGGLRIEAIEDHDGIDVANDIRREFYYNEGGDMGNSTGRVVNVPTYGAQVVLNAASEPYEIDLEPNGYRRTIQSNYPLMKTNGAEVGYGKVTVRTIGGSNIGQTEYYYTTAGDYKDLYDGYYYTPLTGESIYSSLSIADDPVETYPYPRSDSRDYLRGLLTMQIDYRWTGTAYHKVKKVKRSYTSTYNAPLKHLQQFSPFSYLTSSVAVNNESYTSIEGAVWKKGVATHFKRYRIYQGRVDLEKTVTKTYDLGSDVINAETEKINKWDHLAAGYYQVSRTKIKDSNVDTYETKYFYPYDSATLIGLTALEKKALYFMNKKDGHNMSGTVVQQEQYKGTTKLSTTRTNFANYSGYYLPASIETAKGGTALETRVVFNEYIGGNLMGVSKDAGAQQRYIYGYKNQLPTAQIIGASINFDVAYSSFEQASHGNWGYSGVSYMDDDSPTGGKYYRLSEGDITKGLQSNKQYKVTYYAKSGTPSINGVIQSNDATVNNGNGWKYYEKIVSGVGLLTISGSAYIDELRLYPVEAQMTTYTYAPLYGVTSQADTNHGVVKYQYDKFGRIELIKDLDGKVLKAYQYKYQSTTTN